jgi:EAL domain-containing protein (putative c-di-GMP-specific phosphodiesterase class I)/CheY-like chemotaxis protein
MSEPASDETRILLVDDDTQILSFLTRALVSSGAHVTTAGTGAEALDILGKQAFDIVLSDIQMPGMSGLKLLRAVREYDLDLPIVLMTGQPNLSGAAAAVEYGAFQYLIKPVGIDRLRAVITRAVSFGRIARLKRQCAAELSSGTFFVGDRAGVESKLNRALQTLWMAYQPIVRRDGEVLGYEAFLRCEEPMLPNPGAVLKAAERLRRTHDVGRAVRDLVASEVPRDADESSLLFINLHREDLLDPMLYLANAALSRIARRVIFELTDRASLHGVSDVESRVARLRSLGFRIAIDDLGAGEAGLSTITQLEPEFVKLDISVVRGVHRDPTKHRIVQSLVDVCHGMGKLVIAEGVESAEEQSALLSVGCDFLQGYYFGRPSPFLHLERRRIAQLGVAS